MRKARARGASAIKNYRTLPSPSIGGAEASFIFPAPSIGGAEAETGYIGLSEAKTPFPDAEAVSLTGAAGAVKFYGVSDGQLVTFGSSVLAVAEIVAGAKVTIEARSGPGRSLGNLVDGTFINAFIRPSSDNGQIASVIEPAPPAEYEEAIPSLPEADRLALLDRAALPAATAVDPIRAFEERSRHLAFEILGGEAVLGRQVRSDEDLVQALMAGFPAQVLRSLQDAGYPHKVLEQVIAPRRTLMRRRASKQRLTRAESDSAWRLAHVLVMASHVLNGPQSAIAWLTRAKPAFGGQAPVDLLETSVGATHVERLLRRLDWGDIA